MATEVADLDGDGSADLVFMRADGRIDWRSAPGCCGFLALGESDGSSLGSFELAGELDAADVDSDGDLDVLAASKASLRWFENLGWSPWTGELAWARRTLAATGHGRTIEAADLDGDGDLDIVAGDAAATGILYFTNRTPERALGITSLPCDDGVNNDTDAFVDFPSDPGCQTVFSVRENPQCQDGLNNDNQLGVDFDGGASAGNPTGNRDPQCNAAWKNAEKISGCGLGVELGILLPLLRALRRRRTTELRALATSVAER